MIKKEIIFFGKKAVVACDSKCEKAWGLNSRPRIQLDVNNYDDFAFLSDNELDIAPIDPCTYEGDCAKPINKEERLNKWCCRECERCFITNINEHDKEIKPEDLPNFSERVYNIERK